MIATEGGIAALIVLLQSPSTSVQEQAAAALWNLGLNCTTPAFVAPHSPPPANNSELISNEGAISVMVDLMSQNGNTELQRLAAGVLRCLAYMYEPNRVNIAGEGGIKFLCRLLHSNNIKVQQQAAAALGNLTYRNSPNRVSVAQENGVLPLIRLLSSKSLEVVLMAATTLRNLALNGTSFLLISSPHLIFLF